MIYLTSDLHIGHNKDFIYESRGCIDIQEHDDKIIKFINDTVRAEDTLLILGDLCMGDIENAREHLSRIQCKDVKVLIGNHDTYRRVHMYGELGFDCITLGHAFPMRYRKWQFMLSHYPMNTINFDDDGMRRRVWNLHGHTHSKDKFEYFPSSGLNIGVDANNLHPVSIEKVIDIIKENWNGC